MESAGGLGPRLGPVLFQLPPNWHADVERLQGFLDALPAYPDTRATFEFRDPSWLVPEVYALLERAGAAFCIPVRKGPPLNLRLTAPWTYIRIHGGEHGIGLTDEEVRGWAERIAGFRRDGIDTYIYFNNDPEGWAIWNARQLKEILGVGDPAQGSSPSTF